MTLVCFRGEESDCVVSQYVNKRSSKSWEIMMEHFDRCAQEVLEKVDSPNPKVENLLQAVKTAYANDSTQYLAALPYLLSFESHAKERHARQ